MSSGFRGNRVNNRYRGCFVFFGVSLACTSRCTGVIASNANKTQIRARRFRAKEWSQLRSKATFRYKGRRGARYRKRYRFIARRLPSEEKRLQPDKPRSSRENFLMHRSINPRKSNILLRWLQPPRPYWPRTYRGSPTRDKNGFP